LYDVCQKLPVAHDRFHVESLDPALTGVNFRQHRPASRRTPNRFHVETHPKKIVRRLAVRGIARRVSKRTIE
jgi:hypothetical protein